MVVFVVGLGKMGNHPSNHQPLERTNVGKFGDAYTVCENVRFSGGG